MFMLMSLYVFWLRKGQSVAAFHGFDELLDDLRI